eukprot:15275203-Alexandrium_andersonii.AAC.1
MAAGVPGVAVLLLGRLVGRIGVVDLAVVLRLRAARLPRSLRALGGSSSRCRTPRRGVSGR